ncbi:hypothetical protein MBLNU459_g5009t1 [Dothideomycetes sp. NU459]
MEIQALSRMKSHTLQSPTIPNPFQSAHSRWQALTHRNPSAHASFIYGVKTTKIYCRPTCAARLARRANVIFYDTVAQAQHDGFRACKRCKPDDDGVDGGGGGVGGGEEVVARVVALLRVKRDEAAFKGSLKELAGQVGVTPSYLCRVFKRTMGMTVGAYMREFEKEDGDLMGEDVAVQGSVCQSLPGGSTSGCSNVALAAKVDVTGLGLLTPSTTTARSTCSASGEGLNGEKLTDWNLGNLEEVLDLDFDFDEWLWTEYISSDGVYG